MSFYVKVTRFLLLLLLTHTLNGQNVVISDQATATADPSAILDVQSNDKGFLVPRLTTAERTVISNAVLGLLVFDTDTKSFWFRNSTNWTELATAGWLLNGNANTDPLANFVGTTDDQPIKFRVNDIERMSLDNKGRLFLQGEGNITAVGDSALYYNNGGVGNTAIGSKTLFSNVTGNDNTAVGFQTLFSNVSGSSNTVIGQQALFNNVSGIRNSAFGHNALVNNTESYNSAFGFNAMRNNTLGIENTAVGYEALSNNLSGSRNSAFGHNALTNNTESFNSAFGFNALRDNSSGRQNTAVGYQAGQSHLSGDKNSFFGYDAGSGNLTGRENTFIGSSAGDQNMDGIKNVCIGSGSDVALPGLTNAVAIGHSAVATSNNQIRLGDDNIQSICGIVNFTTCSDARFKTNIRENVPGLEFVRKLRPITYQFDKEKLNAFRGKGAEETPTKSPNEPTTNLEGIRYTGFLAQEVEQLATSIGFSFSGVDTPENEKDIYGLRYAEFTVPLVKAVQEQQAIIESQKTEIETLKTQLGMMQQQMQTLIGEVQAIKKTGKKIENSK